MRKLTGEKLEAELARLEGMRAYEHQYESAGIVCGIDEAGRGPLAGPVVAAVAVLPKDCTILRLNDSKKLSEKCREELFLEIKEKAAAAIETLFASPLIILICFSSEIPGMMTASFKKISGSCGSCATA